MRKKNWVFILVPLLIIFVMLFTSAHKTHQLEETIGAHMLYAMNSSQQVFVGRAVKSELDRFALSKQHHVLTGDKTEKLRKLMLDDGAYVFDKSKKCLFTPELVFQIGLQDPVYIFVNLFCQQVKFKHKELEVVLDYDPVGPEFESFCRELLELLDEAQSL